MTKRLMLVAMSLLSIGLVGCSPAGGDSVDDGFSQNTEVKIEPVKLACIGGGEKYGDWNWDNVKANEKLHFTMVSSSKYTLVLENVAANDTFKFAENYAWGTEYGMGQIDWETSTKDLFKEGGILKDDGSYESGGLKNDDGTWAGNHGYDPSKSENVVIQKACKKLTITYYPFAAAVPSTAEENTHGYSFKYIAEF